VAQGIEHAAYNASAVNARHAAADLSCHCCFVLSKASQHRRHEFQGDLFSGKPGNVRGKNLVMEKCPKTVHY